MQSILRRSACCAALAILATVGCSDSNGTKPQNAAITNGPPTPEQKFTNIVETLRRGIEEIPVGFVVQDEKGGHSMMTGRNVVSHKLIPPAEPNGPLTGVITVTSESRYSVQRTTGADDAESEDSSANKNGNAATSTTGGSGTEIYDSDLVSAPGGAARQQAAKTTKPEVEVARKEDKQVREYKLIYQNERWELTTKLDSNTEKAVEFAFQRALESQN